MKIRIKTIIKNKIIIKLLKIDLKIKQFNKKIL